MKKTRCAIAPLLAIAANGAWALEVIAAAESRDSVIASREQAQQWLRLVGYQPTELKLDALTRLVARRDPDAVQIELAGIIGNP